MKTHWNININDKIAELKDDSIKFKFRFEVSLGDGFLSLSQKEVIEQDFSSVLNQNDLAKKASKFLRILGDEFKILGGKVELSNQTDFIGSSMYKVEDDIYVSESGEIYLLKTFGFFDTSFQTAIEEIDENVSKNYIKTTIYNNEHIKHKGHTINAIAETIDGLEYFEFSDDICNTLKFNDTILYIYDSHSSFNDTKNEKDVEILKILYEVLYENTMEFITWNELVESINS